ncbi:WD40/YVTN repeat-like-containing domain [Plasmopara halstedii]|uniref:WD40/YVTN repeat-like-containing domain n=1 Tax=Plasmopara halstedii TaxID=4781 RepID=A0A0P1B2X8_PLAHL|nr:WD40/YVTN repeat-like-containing domain [Plasmopara halstedii]CEG48409.1 WD40/YVTN repeat-like-containing domain [Plasmopara halstedii]|eukprot:XP_024584778.1 WD40/YVTN repeat-like-containing domain [Plasmopara halstedii]
MADAELRVSSAKLEGLLPFPTWNGTLAAPQANLCGLCSVLSANGELVVFQIGSNDDQNVSDSWLRVLKVLPPVVEKSLSFCQCWTSKGEVVATAHERSVVLYSSDHFKVLVKLSLRYSVTSMDVMKRFQTECEFLLVVGTAFGCLLYKVLVGPEDSREHATAAQTLISTVYDGIPVCIVKFSSDGHMVAIGTVDGRLRLQYLDSHEDSELAKFGTMVLSKVLMAPRITSLSFSDCNKKLVVATRKGNVYVFVSSAGILEWTMLPSCKSLSRNPKQGAITTAGTNKAATAAQTLVACWGSLFVVCSRGVASRLEIYEFESGNLLRSLQLKSALVTAEWVNYQLITGVCTTQLSSFSQYTSRLLCHDTSANLTVIEWPFLDLMNRR